MALLSLTWASTGKAAGTAADLVPRYDHIIVIVEENQSYERIMHSGLAPNIARLAQTYGSATQFYSEVHPSEGNYVALLGGDTFGIHDDDAYYCAPGARDPFCPQAQTPGYPPIPSTLRVWPRSSPRSATHGAAISRTCR